MRQYSDPGVALLIAAGFFIASQAAAAANTSNLLECPSVLATRVLPERHRGWSIYSNDPLRLTGADVQYGDVEDATLNPDEVKHLDDENLSVIAVFRLSRHPEAKNGLLVCHYGTHAQLSRRLPPEIRECDFVHHQRFGPKGFEFEASCK